MIIDHVNQFHDKTSPKCLQVGRKGRGKQKRGKAGTPCSFSALRQLLFRKPPNQIMKSQADLLCQRYFQPSTKTEAGVEKSFGSPAIQTHIKYFFDTLEIT